MGAIMNAKIARVPMVITAGQQDLRHILADPLLAADLVQIAAPASKWCFEPNSLDDLPLILRRAFHSSVTPPREPVFLSLPMNILDEIGSPRVLPPSRIELSSVGLGVKELAPGLLKFKPFRTVMVAGNDIALPQARRAPLLHERCLRRMEVRYGPGRRRKHSNANRKATACGRQSNPG